MNNMKWQNSRQGCFVWKPMLLWIIAILCITLSQGWSSSPEKNILETIEIEGISISTPVEMIAEILQARDYTKVNESLYTKQKYADKGRSTISRVEVDDNPAFRQITYYRSMSGGRNKSPTARDAPIPDSDINMAQQLYHSVCMNIADELQNARGCDPFTLATIKFGGAQWIQIDDHFSAILTASDTHATIGVRFSRD